MTPRKKANEEMDDSDFPKGFGRAERSEEIDLDENENILQFLDEYATGTARVDVLRHNEQSHKNERIGTFDYPEEFNPDKLNDKYGGGTFYYILKNEKGKVVKRFHYTYAKPVETKATNEKDEYYKMLLQMSEKQREDIERRSENTVASNKEMFALVLTIMEKNTALVMQMMNRPQENDLDKIIKYKALLGDADPAKSMKTMFDMMQTGVEMGKTYSDKGSDGNVVELATQILAGLMGKKNISETERVTLEDAMNKMKSSVTKQYDVPMDNPPAAKASDTTPPPVEEYTDDEKAYPYIVNLIRENIGMVVNAARFRAPAGFVAGQIANKIEHDGMNDLVYGYFKDHGIDDVLLSFPELSKMHPYLKMVVDEYSKLFSEEENALPVQPGGGDVAGNSADNGPDSTAAGAQPGSPSGDGKGSGDGAGK